MLNNFIFVLLNITCIFILIFLFRIIKLKNKNKIHYLGLAVLILDFIWASGVLLQVYIKHIFGHVFFPLVYYYTIGLYFVPFVSLVFIITFVKPETKFNTWFKLIFIIPVVFYILVWTNNYHHLVYIKYDIDEGAIFGPAIIISGYYSIVLHLVMFGYLSYYLFNNFKLFFKQSLIIGLGFFIPFFINLLIVFDIIKVPVYTNATSVSIALLVVYYGMTKYDILEINPISLKIILNSMSDLFIILDKNFNVIGYNNSFKNKFKYLNINIKENFLNKIKNNQFSDLLLNSIKNKINNKLKLEVQVDDSKDLIFTVEIIPIMEKKILLGLIVIFKDITEIEHMQNILILKERHASLGMLIGAITHSIKTPLMSIAANNDTINTLAYEYKNSIADPSVTTEDHIEIASEIVKWNEKTKSTLENINGILNYVKNQIQSPKCNEEFTIGDLLNSIKLTLKYEENQNYSLQIINNLESNFKLKGPQNLLVQVIRNLIVNSIDSYKGFPTNSEKKIELLLNKNNDLSVIIIKDNGSGITNELKDKLFREMITTKGREGTGLGLYISYSIIKSQFKGDIWFESELGKGTSFFISIPNEREL